MFELEKVLEFLRENLDDFRYGHSIRVMETAVELARIHGVDEEKAQMAGILHDSGKWKSREKTLQKVQDWGIILSEEERAEYNLVHGALSTYIAKNIFGIEDEDVLNAIKNHITGRPAMSDLEKIVYIADMIEPARNYEFIDDFRAMAKVDLDRAMYEILNENLAHLIRNDRYIAGSSLEARNYYLKITKQGEIK
ncbi:MAG: bis(5'-nucleosyl)-tetraphosphatase (symmetrical) YqeK [Ezakiella massiliensis]